MTYEQIIQRWVSQSGQHEVVLVMVVLIRGDHHQQMPRLPVRPSHHVPDLGSQPGVGNRQVTVVGVV